ncbi:hypothetical protein [Flagellimonas sediminis]|uniref:Uncharacterized protein n=1 Tax=Flagellimonas sediminis TaxID=2696468 RepID=A0A6I5KZX8_9FLAO|nr:hypothetical protein [Allomuricauda sediminis]NDV43061.1 hypothetical protein [Allomuricauda sediminis]
MTNKNLELDYQKEIAKIHYYSQYDTSDFNLVIETSLQLKKHGYDDSQINFYVGRAYQELNQQEQAIEFYQKSISTVDAYSNWTKELSSNNLGNIYFDIDSYDECIEVCKSNIANANNDLYKANALYLVAHSYYLKTFKLMKISPTYTSQLIKCLQKAEENVLKALEMQPENVDYLVLAGSMYKKGLELDAGFSVKAKHYLKKAATLGDNQAKQLLNQF